jgi:hypothetical protein
MKRAWRFAAPSAPSTGTSRVLAMPGTGALARIAIEITVETAAVSNSGLQAGPGTELVPIAEAIHDRKLVTLPG